MCKKGKAGDEYLVRDLDNVFFAQTKRTILSERDLEAHEIEQGIGENFYSEICVLFSTCSAILSRIYVKIPMNRCGKISGNFQIRENAL